MTEDRIPPDAASVAASVDRLEETLERNEAFVGRLRSIMVYEDAEPHLGELIGQAAAMQAFELKIVADIRLLRDTDEDDDSLDLSLERLRKLDARTTGFLVDIRRILLLGGPMPMPEVLAASSAKQLN